MYFYFVCEDERVKYERGNKVKRKVLLFLVISHFSWDKSNRKVGGTKEVQNDDQLHTKEIHYIFYHVVNDRGYTKRTCHHPKGKYNQSGQLIAQNKI